MNLDEKTIDELKVIAYDLLATQEQTTRNLQLVNQTIAKKYEAQNKLTKAEAVEVLEAVTDIVKK